MTQTKKVSKTKSKIAAVVADIRDENAYRMSLIKALNATNVEIENSQKKDLAFHYMKTNGFSVRGLGLLADSTFRSIGTLVHINTNVMKLNDQDMARLHTMITDLVRNNARVEPEIVVTETPAKVVPVLSIRDKMSVKADKLMTELDQAIDDLIAGKPTDFEISKWIAVNAIPGMMCKMIVDKMATTINDFEMIHAKDPDYLEAYSHIPAARRKMIRNVLNHMVSCLTNHKTVKPTKPISKRQKAKTATAKFSRAVLRTKAFELMKDGKTNKDIVNIFVGEFHVKQATSNSYVYGFRKEFSPT